MDIKEIIKDNRVNMSFYRAGVIYYSIDHKGDTFQFPVRLDDIADATLMKEDKAILFMRYIRKALDSNEFVKAV